LVDEVDGEESGEGEEDEEAGEEEGDARGMTADIEEGGVSEKRRKEGRLSSPLCPGRIRQPNGRFEKMHRREKTG